jgi:hypothetical protein
MSELGVMSDAKAGARALGVPTLAQDRRASIDVRGTQERSAASVRIVGTITLMEGWFSNNPDRTFINQQLEIRAQTKSSRLGRDGRLSVTCQPMTITWYGGKAEDLKDVSRIRVESYGRVLIDDTLDTLYGQPKAAPGGISFNVL